MTFRLIATARFFSTCLVFSAISNVLAQPAGGQGDCPPGYTLGDPGAPNSILFREADGDRTVHFAEAWLILENGRFTLEIPGFQRHEWNLTPLDDSRKRSPRGAAEQKVQISGRRALDGCLAIPKEMQSDDMRVVPEGMLVFKGGLPAAGADAFAASFEFKAADAPKVAILGEITAGKVLDLNPRDLDEKGRYVDAKSGETHEIHAAVACHLPHLNQLIVNYQYRANRGINSSGFHVMEFQGEPGVFTRSFRAMVDGAWIDMVEIKLVDRFAENDVAVEIRDVLASELPEGELNAEQARALGALRIQLRCKQLVVKPERARIR